MKKISFFLPSLNGGGAERVTVNLINKLLDYNVEVHLVLVKKQGVFLKDLNSKVKIFDLHTSRAMFSIFPLLRYLKNEKPDYLISSLNYLNTIALFCKKLYKGNTKFYITEHSTISQRLGNLKGTGRIVPFLMKRLYNEADHIICVSNGIKQDLISTLDLSNPNISVIYNPIDFEKIRELKKEEIKHPFFEKDDPVIIGVGRLIKEKNFELLINSFLKVREFKNCKLIILGTGPLESNLRSMIDSSKYAKDIDLIGFKENPYAWMNKADLFVLSSLTEGLPTVLIEAMAVGCNVISTDCPSGPKEIILNCKRGVLVENNNLQSLTNAIINNLELDQADSKDGLLIFDKVNILKKYIELMK